MEHVSRVDKLTPEQEAAMASYRDEWIAKGLKTGETDWETFDKYMPVCYAKADLQYPTRVVRVSSPLVGGLAASVAEGIWQKRRGAVDDAVRGSVRGAVDDAVRGAVRDAVGDAVGGAVGDAVGDAVRGAVGDAVSTAIAIAKKAGVSMSWHYWLGGQFWVGWWWGPAFVNFFFDICKLKLAQDIMERAEAYRKVCESVNYIWPNRDFVMVCARPTKINRDSRGQLHSDREKSIEYPDGWGLYHLHGVRFEETLWKKVVSRTMPFADILKIEDIDQRKQAMKYGNVWDFVKYAGGVELDTDMKVGAKDGRKIRYWLYKFPAGLPKADPLFEKDAYYAIYDDSMLGAAEVHMQGVPECKTVAEAFAWKQSDDFYTVTPEQWKNMVLDIDFS